MQVQSSIIDETIDIVDKDGNTLRSIPFRLDITSMAQSITELRQKFGAIDKTDVEAVGKTTIDLFKAVYGEDTMAQLLDFYGDNYVALVTDLTPMMVDHIFPAIDDFREKLIANRKRLKK